MTARLLDSLGTTEALEEIFSDESFLAAMLRFEVALARVEARIGLIPGAAAEAIERVADPHAFDPAAMAAEARTSGTLTIPLVARLTARVRADAPDAAVFVHRGATSQDVSDTALVICVARAAGVLAKDHGRLLTALRRLSDDHASTVMLARTLLQPATPTTFGLLAAGWFGAISRAGTRLLDAFEHARVLQFGGAAGTLAALGTDGPAVARALASELHLREPGAPWHVHRDRLATLVTACGVYTGTLGKIARDVSLHMQYEVSEVAEPGGSSSTMPHKRNPAACAIALAAATRVPGLVAAYLAAMPQELERGVGNWHSEPATVSSVVEATGAALAALTDAAERLHVDPDRMRANLEATRGVVFAEQARMVLAPVIGAASAQQAIDAALEAVRGSGADFVQALLSIDTVRTALNAEDRKRLGAAEEYLGSAELFRRRLLDEPEHG